MSSAVIAAARAGSWHVILTPNKPVPAHWFGDLKNKDVLGLPSGGGQQVPLFAAADANVTSFDNSSEQRGKDRCVADLSRCSDASFDLILLPMANVLCADILPV